VTGDGLVVADDAERRPRRERRISQPTRDEHAEAAELPEDLRLADVEIDVAS
jgi:hypothetical protein